MVIIVILLSSSAFYRSYKYVRFRSISTAYKGNLLRKWRTRFVVETCNMIFLSLNKNISLIEQRWISSSLETGISSSNISIVIDAKASYRWRYLYIIIKYIKQDLLANRRICSVILSMRILECNTHHSVVSDISTVAIPFPKWQLNQEDKLWPWYGNKIGNPICMCL